MSIASGVGRLSERSVDAEIAGNDDAHSGNVEDFEIMVDTVRE